MTLSNALADRVATNYTLNQGEKAIPMFKNNPADLYTTDVLNRLLPPELSDQFFDALYGDADEGAYNISLAFKEYVPKQNLLSFELQLKERPGKCLACNLTHGLPEVFARHPLINIQGMVAEIAALLDGPQACGWELGRTQTQAANLHTIQLSIWLG